jgi:YggT family protein
MHSLISLILMVIQLYIWILIASAILSWLLAFNVLNTSNRFVYSLSEFLYRITEPALRPIRRVVPLVGGIDISPVVLILLLIFVQNLIVEYLV